MKKTVKKKPAKKGGNHAWHFSPEGRAWHQQQAERRSARMKEQNASPEAIARLRQSGQRLAKAAKAWRSSSEGRAELRQHGERMRTVMKERHASPEGQARLASPEFLDASRKNGQKFNENGHMERMSEAAKAWHASPKGRAWHRDHAKKQVKARVAKTYTCIRCGKDYQSQALHTTKLMYCSRKCKGTAFYRGGIRSTQRTCLQCKEVFTLHASIKNVFCTRSCAGAYARSKALPSHNFGYTDSPRIIEPNESLST